MIKSKNAESINKYDLLVGNEPGFSKMNSCLTTIDLWVGN